MFISSPVNYVDRIAYNAKGQQLLVAYGNGIMTRFLYREDNFRFRLGWQPRTSPWFGLFGQPPTAV